MTGAGLRSGTASGGGRRASAAGGRESSGRRAAALASALIACLAAGGSFAPARAQGVWDSVAPVGPDARVTVLAYTEEVPCPRPMAHRVVHAARRRPRHLVRSGYARAFGPQHCEVLRRRTLAEPALGVTPEALPAPIPAAFVAAPLPGAGYVPTLAEGGAPIAGPIYGGGPGLGGGPGIGGGGVGGPEPPPIPAAPEPPGWLLALAGALVIGASAVLRRRGRGASGVA